MWMDQSCKGSNQIATKLALIVLWLQPLSQCIGWLYASSDKKYVNYILIPVVIYSLCVASSMVTVTLSHENWCSKPQKCFSLQWNFNKFARLSPTNNWPALIIYGIGMIVPIFFQKPTKRAISLITINLLSITLLRMYYHSRGESASSMWCFTSNIYVWLAYFIK